MRDLCLLFAVIGLNAQPLRAAEPFWLQLTSVSAAWLPGGAVVQVPAGSNCQKLQVKLEKAFAGGLRVDALQLAIDDRYPRFSRLTGDEGFILLAQTREPLGLIPKEEHHIAASLEGSDAMHTDWRIERWKREYVQAQAVGAEGGSPIDISLEQPLGGVVVGGRSDSKVRLRGELRGGGLDAKLKVNGETIHRRADQAGYHFDQEIPVPAGAREVVLVASDQAGDQTVLALPVQN